MTKRRLRFDFLEERLCMAAPTFQTSVALPTGSWTPSVYRASPLFVDIFNTGKDNLIAVAAGAKLVAYASNLDGSATPVVTYQVPAGVADIKSTPIVVTDPRTGRKDLFAAMGRDENQPSGTLEDGRVFGWDLQTGSLLPGWTQGISTGRDDRNEGGVYGALTSGQLENNGLPDIVVTSFSTNVMALRLDGSVLWSWTNDDTILSGAVVGDIDRDGHPEVVVGGDSSESIFYHAGGWVNVLSDQGILKWRKFIPGEVTWSSPVLADLNNNGFLDIVIGTGLNFQNQKLPGSQEAGNKIFAFDPFGNILPGWPYATTFAGNPTPHEVLAAPAVADLLGNGQLEVIALDRAGYIHVIQANGRALPGFEGGKSLAPELSQNLLADNFGSPSVADINGDGKPEVIGAAGPFVRAFDNRGNLIPIATTVTPRGGTPEGVDSAPAIGRFNATGGLTLAFTSYNPQAQNRPDLVTFYQLPSSTLAPPWPMLRRTASGDAVKRSPVYDHLYINAVFTAALGSSPSPATVQPYYNALDSNALNLLSTAQLITGSASSRQVEVNKLYNAFLGRNADPGGVTYWSNYLAANTYRSMMIQLASGAEFAQRAGRNLGQEISLLYRAILQRTPSAGEINYWVGTALPIGAIANVFVNSQEAINLQLNAIYVAGFGAGAQNTIPADAQASFSYDTHVGAREDVMIAAILASRGNYASTNFLAGYVADLYRDVLHRVATPGEVAYWVRNIDSNTLTVQSLPRIFLNSLEARGIYVQTQFLTLLGHGADAATVASLANFPSRESLLISLVGSAEYYARHGSNPAGFVAAAFLDLTSVTIDQATINSFVAKMKAGLSTAGVAQQIIFGGTLYFTNTIVGELQTYLPDQRLGVLRVGNGYTGGNNVAINPDPNLINYCLGLQLQGFTDEQIIGVLLSSPQYYARVAYFKGLYRAPGIRN